VQIRRGPATVSGERGRTMPLSPRGWEGAAECGDPRARRPAFSRSLAILLRGV